VADETEASPNESNSGVQPAGIPSAPPPEGKRRKPSHVKAASKLLRKEARRILKRHRERLGDAGTEIDATVARLQELDGSANWALIEDTAEHLDELLEKHAKFARKGAFRETVENVGIAVLVALGLRSCIYEPFKIPSESMLPTLLVGDHIFVNKHDYGIQVPLTNTVVFEDMFSEIKRGDVVVFRWPLDPGTDFIKRVIGTPGDTVRVRGDSVAIKRADDDDFELLPHKKLAEPCKDDTGDAVVRNCDLYEETLDGHTYVIRIFRGKESVDATLTVPEGHLLVMGDNRRQSDDSLRWRAPADVVFASSLLTGSDLRTVVDDDQLDVVSRGSEVVSSDPTYDEVSLLAELPSPIHDMALQVWRAPTLGASAVFEAAAGDGERLSLSALAERAGPPGTATAPDPAVQARIAAVDPTLGAVAWTRDDLRHRVTARSTQGEFVMQLDCGVGVCTSPMEAARRLAEAAEELGIDPDQSAKVILRRPPAYKYKLAYQGRHGGTERFVERLMTAPGNEEHTSVGDELRLRAWRQPGEGASVVFEAAVASIGEHELIARDDGHRVAVARTEQTSGEGKRGVWRAAGWSRSDIVFAIDCGDARCKSAADVAALAESVLERTTAAARDASQLASLLSHADAPDWHVPPQPKPQRYEWDRIRYAASLVSPSHGLKLEVRRATADQSVEVLGEQLARGLTTEPQAVTGGVRAETPAGLVSVFTADHGLVDGSPSGVAVKLTCAEGLCPNPEVLDALAERAQQRAKDRDAVVRHDPSFPKPFVPRGFVKGRADRIWLPFRRFWTRVR
jgi:signal peptidase I